MAHNRSLYIASSTAQPSEKSPSKMSHDTQLLHQEVEAPHSILEETGDEFFEHRVLEVKSNYVAESENEKVTITLQQLSMGAALFLCASFIIFSAGFSMGRYKVVSIDSPSATPTIASLWEMLVTSGTFQKVSYHDNEYARFATEDEADAYKEVLTQRGYKVKVVERVSYSAQGKEAQWFHIIDID